MDSEYGKITHFLITWNCDSFYFFLEIGFSNCSVISVESGDILPSKISFIKQKSQVQFFTISKRKTSRKSSNFLIIFFFSLECQCQCQRNVLFYFTLNKIYIVLQAKQKWTCQKLSFTRSGFLFIGLLRNEWGFLVDYGDFLLPD